MGGDLLPALGIAHHLCVDQLMPEVLRDRGVERRPAVRDLLAVAKPVALDNLRAPVVAGDSLNRAADADHLALGGKLGGGGDLRRGCWHIRVGRHGGEGQEQR